MTTGDSDNSSSSSSKPSWTQAMEEEEGDSRSQQSLQFHHNSNGGGGGGGDDDDDDGDNSNSVTSPPPPPPTSSLSVINNNNNGSDIIMDIGGGGSGILEEKRVRRIEVETNILQVANIAPQATREQMQGLFGYVGKIEDLRLYPTVDIGMQYPSKICFVKFREASSVGVAQHLSNTVFVDRALIVIPYSDGDIPDEAKGLELLNTGSMLPGIADPKLPQHVTSRIEGIPPGQVVVTTDPKLRELGLPNYPNLPPTFDSRRIEEIRRTVMVANVDPEIESKELMEFFSNAGEVKYLRMCTRDNDPLRYALVEFTEQPSTLAALQLNGSQLGTKNIKVYHSTQAIVKPQAKSNEAAQKEIEEAMTRQAQNLLTQGIDTNGKAGAAMKDKARRSRSGSRPRGLMRSNMGIRRSPRSRTRSPRRRSRSRSPRSRRHRSRSRSPRRSRRSRSRGRVARSPWRHRSRSRSRSRDRRRSTSRSRYSKRSRSRSKDRRREKKSKRDKERRSRSRDKDRGSKGKEKENGTRDDSIEEEEKDRSREKEERKREKRKSSSRSPKRRSTSRERKKRSKNKKKKRGDSDREESVDTRSSSVDREPLPMDTD